MVTRETGLFLKSLFYVEFLDLIYKGYTQPIFFVMVMHVRLYCNDSVYPNYIITNQIMLSILEKISRYHIS